MNTCGIKYRELCYSPLVALEHWVIDCLKIEISLLDRKALAHNFALKFFLLFSHIVPETL